MKRIFKYNLEQKELQIVQIPRGGEILCVQVQNCVPCIWALIDEDNPLANIYIEIYPTGEIILSSNNRKYIGTYQLHGGILVYHCFERLLN